MGNKFHGECVYVWVVFILTGMRSLFVITTLVAFSLPAFAGVGLPDFYGYLGYGYRSVNEDSSATESHQISGTINAETYIWQPWFAIADMSLIYTGDSSNNSSDIYNSSLGRVAAVESETSSDILTGDFGLNLLPRSKTPFSLRAQVTDSRVEYGEVGVTPIVFVGKEYSTSYIGLRQSLLMGLGSLQFRYDHRSSGEQGGGEYTNNSIGLNADLRWAKQRLVVRTSYDKGSYDLSERANKNFVFDVSSFYAASRHFRLDTKASIYQYDRSFLDAESIERRFSRRDIAQVSSNAFYRPVSVPLSLSAGVRVSSTDGRAGGVTTNDQLQVSLMSGAFYRINQNMRLDLSFSSIFKRVGDVSSGDHRQHLGWRYDSPLLGRINKNITYKWYMAANVDGSRNTTGEVYSIGSSLGQNLSRVFYFGERTGTTNLRVFANQAIKYTSSRASSAGDKVARIDHSLSSAFNQRIWGGQTLLQATLSDSRDVMDSSDVRQLVNFQFNRTQDVTGNSSLTGNYTAQYVLHEYEEIANYAGVDEFTGQVVSIGDVVRRERDVVTMSGGIRYNHTRLFGVSRLTANLGYRVAQTSTDGAIDRSDTNLGVFYSIGMLDLSATYSLTDADGRNYDLLYFRAMRRY